MQQKPRKRVKVGLAGPRFGFACHHAPSTLRAIGFEAGRRLRVQIEVFLGRQGQPSRDALRYAPGREREPGVKAGAIVIVGEIKTREMQSILKHGSSARSKLRKSAAVKEDVMVHTSARALWYIGPWVAELREEELAQLRPGQVLVRSLYSGVSRGTERLVLSGSVAESERERMRCPMQSGVLPFPVKYGYGAVGRVEEGGGDLLGRTVVVLHPHQDVFVAPVDMVYRLPEGVPARRAVLAANMETALNAMWDSGAGPADRIAIIGGGIVGLLIGFLAARLPGADVTLVDVCPERQEIAAAFGCRFTAPDAAPSGCDVVFHTSATSEGLAAAISCAGFEAPILELSWYGDGTAAAPLGGAFHSQRLKLICSQVGQVSQSRRPRWSHRQRMEAALRLLLAPELDLLTSVEIPFEEAAKRLPGLLRRDAQGLAPVMRYF